MIKIDQKDAKWLVKLSQAIDRDVAARLSFIEYLYEKHELKGSDVTFNLEQMAFVPKEEVKDAK